MESTLYPSVDHTPFFPFSPPSIVIWMGDMNYRLTLPPEMHLELVRSLADNYQLPQLLKYDQVQWGEGGGM